MNFLIISITYFLKLFKRNGPPRLTRPRGLGYIFGMEKEEFESLVEDALASVPEWFLEKLENIEVIIEDEPSGGLMRRMGVGKGGTLLGLYEGVPLDRRGLSYGNVLPDRIVLFMGPILGMGGTPDEIAERVREVVVHEIGHYFGLSDDELSRLEKEKGQ